jgi:hypothetical protein
MTSSRGSRPWQIQPSSQINRIESITALDLIYLAFINTATDNQVTSGVM